MTEISTGGRLDRSSHSDSLSDWIVVLSATMTALVAAWLLLVTRTILPARDPNNIAFWTAVAVGLLGYVGLTAVHLRSGRRSARTRWIAAAASVLAIVVGGLLVVTALIRTNGFEGYLVLVGAILAGHGVAVLISEASRRRADRPPRL